LAYKKIASAGHKVEETVHMTVELEHDSEDEGALTSPASLASPQSESN